MEHSALYILRIWRENTLWRASLTNSQTLEKQFFSSREALETAVKHLNALSISPIQIKERIKS